MSFVNIIVPCYNGEKYLDRFFLSLKNLTFKDFDIFIVDDGSTDNSKGVINKYKEIFAKENIELNYFYKENGGAASAVNVALKQNLTGKYLLILDCDDEITADSLEKKVDFMEKNPAYGAVTSYYEFIDNDTNQTLKIHEVRGITVNRAQTFENILLARDVVFAGYLFNKEKLFSVLQNGQIYESRGGQNWQLLLPIAYNFPIGVIKEVLYKYYVIKSSHSHSGNKTREAFEKKYGTHKEILDETLKRMNVYEHYAKFVERYVSYHLAVLSYRINDKNMMKEYYKRYRKAGFFNFRLFVKYVLMSCGLKR